MAKNNKKTLGMAIVVMALTSVGANASELWQYSNPLFEALDLSAGNSATVASTQSWTSQTSFSAAQTTTAQWNTPVDSWYSSAAWSGGASSASTVPVQTSDDLFRGFLFSGTSNTASPTVSNSSWFSGFFGGGSAVASSDQSSNSFWGSYNGWSGTSLGSATSSQTNSGGAWWSGYSGFGGGATASSDSAACSMVSSWAGTSGWRSFFDGGEAAQPAASTSSSCSAQQSSTISNLAPTTNLVATTNGPVLAGTESSNVIETTDNPEPGTWLMMAGGLGLLGYLRRNKASA